MGFFVCGEIREAAWRAALHLILYAQDTIRTEWPNSVPRINQAVVGPLTLQGSHPAKEKRHET